MWTPTREDLCIELAGEIGDEDTTLVERAEAKAERLENLSERRTQDADRAQKAVHAIADGIPFGQPILVGHHSERHARKDAEKIENGMRKAVECWKAAQYWQDRAKGAIRLAKYKAILAQRLEKVKLAVSYVRSAKSLLSALPKRRFRWTGGPFETGARTVARIKVRKLHQRDGFLHDKPRRQPI
jgi:hypothetical protein